jgi:hypothetical protein
MFDGAAQELKIGFQGFISYDRDEKCALKKIFMKFVLTSLMVWNAWGDFRHISFAGLGSAVVIKRVFLALMAHHESFFVGGFVFQAASGEIVDRNRPTPLEEIYDALPGLKNELRYNRRTGLPKKAPQPLIPDYFQAYKTVTTGRACYVVLR